MKNFHELDSAILDIRARRRRDDTMASRLIAFSLLIAEGVVLILIGLTLFVRCADAHDALPTAARPQGWSYPFSCCSGYDCREVNGDNPVQITEAGGGFRVNTTGEVIPYGDTRLKDSQDGEYHWCSVAGALDSRTICLFVPPRSY